MRFFYDGIDMSKFFRISRVERSISNDRYFNIFDQPKIGALVSDVRTGPKIIKVYIEPLEVSNILTESLKHELAGVLNVSEPKRMQFGDEPDKYYLGLVQGEISTEKVARWYQRAVITFFIPDGVAHSSTYKRVIDYTQEKNVLTFAIENNGNVDAYPIINIKNNEESGYFGVVNQNGILEIGNIKEQDTEEFKSTEYLLDFKSNPSTPFIKNVGIFNDDAWALTGDVDFLNRSGRTFTEMTTINNQNGQNGASLTFDIPADSNGDVGSLFDYLRWRQSFEMVGDAQGIFKISVTDDQDEFLYGIQTVKYANGWGAYYDVLARNDEGVSTVVKRFNLKTTNKIGDNPLALQRGNSDLKRVDDKLTAYWDTKYYDFFIPGIKGKKSKKIHFLFGNFGNKKYPMRSNYNNGCNYLEWFRYAKNFVVKERDVKNKYPAGAHIIINNEDNTVTVDGLSQANDVVHGSTFLTIPPGKSELKLYLSDWITKTPTVSINYEERWL